MPYMKNGKRDYETENRKYNSRPEQKKKRASRNKVRQQALRKGKVRLGDTKDIDHKNKNPLDNSSSNLRVQERSTNRSFKRDKNGGHKRT